MTDRRRSAAEQVDELLTTPDLVDALASDQFKQFLDHLPIAILVGEIADGRERVVYANLEALERLGCAEDEIIGKPWEGIDPRWTSHQWPSFAAAVRDEQDAVGALGDGPVMELNASLIEDDEGRPKFRIVALVELPGEDVQAKLREKDLLLLEIQHRVKNNLQMITALIRMETRKAGGRENDLRFDRLAGRVEALGLLYQQLSGGEGDVDLGSYLSQIASSVMKAQAIEGVRLNHQVDVIPAPVNVAMPLGLLVNELVTNALKYAFVGRDEGEVTVRCLREKDGDCLVSVSDDGVGMGDEVWPKPGKLGYLIARSIVENVKAKIDAVSEPGCGVATTVRFRLP
ncbi:two-component sensor histidine kinase [Methylopila capsulata]|uniref:histidine kinase n=1 Tax=Methylopila capsulata TaxID=61654 RepID=A0A9W6IT90_9HYPH|nr:histidine kinase dimerization/phosphoacceptor domain -containing protein [Methylopila capsulata]MBM7849884.1 two-component sensor histidine kinase [Methylopila capsulata]GLK55174.1 sensor histidine kinase [Methylopila capsulata]